MSYKHLSLEDRHYIAVRRKKGSPLNQAGCPLDFKKSFDRLPFNPHRFSNEYRTLIHSSIIPSR